MGERSSSTPARIAMLLPGALVGVLAAILVIVGGALLYVTSRQDAGGYLSTGTHGLAARSYAIASDDLDLDLDALSWAVREDAVRITATSPSGRPLFVGVAPAAAAQEYLRGVAHARIRDISTDPFRAQYVQHGGARRPGLPGRAGFWSASAAGAGTQTVTWPVQDGSWTLVVMKADGSPAIGAEVRLGAKVPRLAVVAWSSTLAGILCLALAAALLAGGVRLGRRTAGGGA